MNNQRLRVRVRPMTLDDIPHVLDLDRLSFPIPWSAHTYRHEIQNNDNSTMLVVEPVERAPAQDEQPAHRPRLWRWPPEPAPAHNPLMAYAGFWHIADEAHISTIAVHPDWRGHKLGELLIWTIAREAMRRNAAMVTLEVRVSNQVAQNLYHKYGFQKVGTRRGYYRDNHEDAYMMSVTPLNAAYRETLAAFGHELAQRLDVVMNSIPRGEW